MIYLLLAKKFLYELKAKLFQEAKFLIIIFIYLQ